MTDVSSTDPLLIPACLSVGEGQDHKTRLLGLMAQPGPLTIDFTEAEGRAHPSVISLQLCLSAAAQLTAAGSAPRFGPEAKRLLAAQKLL